MLKKIPLLATASAVFLFSHAFAQDFLLSNPGFEQELSDWNLQYAFGMCSAISEASHSGSLGLRFEDKKDTEGCEVRSFSDVAHSDTEYELSFWARTLDGKGPLRAALVFVNDNGKSIRQKNPTVDVSDTPEWTQFRLKVRSPAEDVSGMYVQIRTPVTGYLTADVDDISVLKVP